MNRLAALPVAAALALACASSLAEPVPGFSPCTANPPASLSVSSVSSNQQLSQCGPTVYVYNITSQEVFWTIGSAPTTAATTSAKSLPGNMWMRISVPDNDTAGWYFAAITSTGTSTLRFVQGRSQ